MDNLTLSEEIKKIKFGQLDEGRAVKFQIISHGMSFLVTAKDHVFVKRVPLKNIKKWDIILFKNFRGGFSIHRVLKKEVIEGGLFFITKADSRKFIFRPVPSENVIGKVISVEKPWILIRLESLVGKLISLAVLYYSKFYFKAPGRLKVLYKKLEPILQKLLSVINSLNR